MDSTTIRRTHGWREATRDPIYLLQHRRWFWFKEPAGWEHDGEHFVPDGSLPMDELLEKWPEAEQEDGILYLSLWGIEEKCKGEYCDERWETELVFFTREEGEAYGNGRAYNYPQGWRVYCVPAEGALAALLKERTDRDESEAPQ